MEALGLNDDSKDVKSELLNLSNAFKPSNAWLLLSIRCVSEPDIDPKRKLEQDRIIAILNSSDVAYTAISDVSFLSSLVAQRRRTDLPTV